MTRATYLEKLEKQSECIERTSLDDVQLIPRCVDNYLDGDIITLPTLDNLLLYKDLRLNGAVFFAAETVDHGYIQFFPTSFQKMRIEASRMPNGTIVNGALRRASGTAVDSWLKSPSLKEFLTNHGGRKFKVKLSDGFYTRAFDQKTRRASDTQLDVAHIPSFDWI